MKPSEIRDVRLQGRARGRGLWFLLAGVAGALTAFFADPERGNARRQQAIDRLGAMARDAQGRTRRTVRGIQAQVNALSQRATHLRLSQPEVDDQTLRDRVESELFRDPEIPKGNINLDLADGRVTVRGQLHRPEQIRQVQERIARIPGVREVQSYLHLQGTEAPNQAEVRAL